MTDSRGLCLYGSSAVRVLERAVLRLREWAEKESIDLSRTPIEATNVVNTIEHLLEDAANRDYAGLCDCDKCASDYKLLYKEPLLRLVK